MLYNNKFVACLVVSGRIVREVGDTAYLPFGSEYVIRLKNLDVRRAVASISIDGTDVLGGTQVLVEAGKEIDIKAPLDAHSNVGHNRFKFIEKTDKISEHRGDKADDGMIRITFQFEEPPIYIPPPPVYRRPIKRVDPWHPYDDGRPIWSSSIGGASLGDSMRSKGLSDNDSEVSCSSMDSAFSCNNISEAPSKGVLRGAGMSELPNDRGITVAGSVVDQQWTTTHVGRLSPETHVLVFQLKGYKSDGTEVEQPLLVRTKVECPTCGTKNKSGNKFCPECATSLV